MRILDKNGYEIRQVSQSELRFPIFREADVDEFERDARTFDSIPGIVLSTETQDDLISKMVLKGEVIHRGPWIQDPSFTTNEFFEFDGYDGGFTQSGVGIRIHLNLPKDFVYVGARLSFLCDLRNNLFRIGEIKSRVRCPRGFFNKDQNKVKMYNTLSLNSMLYDAHDVIGAPRLDVRDLPY